MSLVFEASIESGEPSPDGEETSEVGWFHAADLAAVELNHFNRHLLATAVPLLNQD